MMPFFAIYAMLSIIEESNNKLSVWSTRGFNMSSWSAVTEPYAAGSCINPDAYSGFSKEASTCVIEVSTHISIHDPAYPLIHAPLA